MKIIILTLLMLLCNGCDVVDNFGSYYDPCVAEQHDIEQQRGKPDAVIHYRDSKTKMFAWQYNDERVTYTFKKDNDCGCRVTIQAW